jgi:glutamate dehydrogenase
MGFDTVTTAFALTILNGKATMASLNGTDNAPSYTPSPKPTHIAWTHTQRILKDDTPGYIAPAFEGKEKQMEQVMDMLEEKGFLPVEFVESETKWFYTSLGIDDMYFKHESVVCCPDRISERRIDADRVIGNDHKQYPLAVRRESRCFLSR